MTHYEERKKELCAKNPKGSIFEFEAKTPVRANATQPVKSAAADECFQQIRELQDFQGQNLTKVEAEAFWSPPGAGVCVFTVRVLAAAPHAKIN